MVFFKGGSRGQISPCLCMISQRNKRKVGSVVNVARRLTVLLPDTQGSDADIPVKSF